MVLLVKVAVSLHFKKFLVVFVVSRMELHVANTTYASLQSSLKF